MGKFLEIDNLSFSFKDKKILDNINLSLEKDSSYALLGKSGIGKSTILNLISGFLKATEGEIRFNDEIIRKPRREISFLFQELGLFPWQTVKEAVSMPLKIKKIEDDNKVINLLKDIGLENHINKYPKELSGGEKQRVALARTLINEPEVLLMDEPTSALDSMTKEEIQDLILKEHIKRKTTLIFVTHDIEEAIILAKNIIILNSNGRLTEYKNPYYGMKKVREELGFYDECIKIRKLLREEA